MVVWGRYGEAISKSLAKGQLVSVSGKNRTWRSNNGGVGYHLEAERVRLLGARRGRSDVNDLPWAGVEGEDEFEALLGATEEETKAGEFEVSL